MGLVAKIGLVGHVEDYININNNHVTIHRSLFSREQNGGMVTCEGLPLPPMMSKVAKPVRTGGTSLTVDPPNQQYLLHAPKSASHLRWGNLTYKISKNLQILQSDWLRYSLSIHQ